MKKQLLHLISKQKYNFLFRTQEGVLTARWNISVRWHHFWWNDQSFLLSVLLSFMTCEREDSLPIIVCSQQTEKNSSNPLFLSLWHHRMQNRNFMKPNVSKTVYRRKRRHITRLLLKLHSTGPMIVLEKRAWEKEVIMGGWILPAGRNSDWC